MTTYQEGQTIRITRIGQWAEDGLARFDRRGSTGMIYATRIDGSDAVAFEDEVTPEDVEITVAAKSFVPPSFGGERAILVDYAKRNADRAKRRRRPRPGRDWAHLEGHSLKDVAKMAGCTPNTVQKAFRAGLIEGVKHGRRTVRVTDQEAKKWIAYWKSKKST